MGNPKRKDGMQVGTERPSAGLQQVGLENETDLPEAGLRGRDGEESWEWDWDGEKHLSGRTEQG